MKGAFMMDSPFFRVMARIGDIFILNLAFVITSIPVVTTGASITALMTMTVRMTTNREGYILPGFLKAFKTNFKQATLIHLLLSILGVILFFDLHFWVNLQRADASMMIIVSIIPIMVYFMVLLYVYVQQAIFENRIMATIRNALLMAVKNLPFTLLLGIAMTAAVYLAYLSRGVRIFMVVYGFGLFGYGTAIIYRYIYREYLDEPEGEETEITKEENEQKGK